MEVRHIKRIGVTRLFLNTLFNGEEVHFRVKNPLPEGTKLLQMVYDINTDKIIAIIEHPSFPEVTEAEIPEYYMMEVEELKKEEAVGEAKQ